MTTTARKIASARIEAGLTQEELAQAAQVSLSAIQQYERGTISPRAKRLRAISEATGKPLAYFLADDAPPDDVQTSSASVGGLTITGPEDAVARLLALQDPTHDNAPPPGAMDAGVRELLADVPLLRSLGATPAHIGFMRALPAEGWVGTKQQAIQILLAVLRQTRAAE